MSCHDKHDTVVGYCHVLLLSHKCVQQLLLYFTGIFYSLVDTQHGGHGGHYMGELHTGHDVPDTQHDVNI